MFIRCIPSITRLGCVFRFLFWCSNFCDMEKFDWTMAAVPWLILYVHFFEAALHHAIIKGQDHEKPWWNKTWHNFFFRLWMVIYIVLFISGVHWSLLLMGAVSRLFIFSSRLNHLRGKPFAYVSNQGIDKWVGKLSDSVRRWVFIGGIVSCLLYAAIWTCFVLF